jgi:1,2-diacylglycerol 3-alpha-glucosyltransferase
MKIAILGQSYPPMISGAALFSCHLAEALAERGHEVLVLAASDRGKPYCQQRGRLTILRLQSYPNPKRVSQRFLLWGANEIRAALRDFSPQVINVYDPFQIAYFAKTYAHRAGIPCIFTIHGLPSLVSALAPDVPGIQHIVEKGLWGYASWLLQQFEYQITPTATIARLVAEQTGIRPHVISGGVNLNTFCADPLPSQMETSLRDDFGIPGDAKIILHVGRLDTDKTVKTVVRAAALAMNSLPIKNVHLLIVGDGCEKLHLIRLTEELGIAGFCHFPGYISDPNRLSTVYRMADLFITASEIETQGLVLLEAAACGLPIVAVNAMAIPEMVTDGVNGFLVQPGDVAAMAQGVADILSEPGIHERMRKASRQASLAHDFNYTVGAYEVSYLSAIQNQAFSQKGKADAAKQVLRV